jgi:DNA (cytosine-5)-methyltransferase 1
LDSYLIHYRKLILKISIHNKIYNFDVQPIKKKSKSLESVLDVDVPEEYYLSEEQINKVKYLKDRKKILRNSNGFKYYFSEGRIPFPDDTSKPARTILTSEGQLNRSSHFIRDKKGIRFLTPNEVERINGFPKNWTYFKGIPKRKRYFLMGNALSIKIINIIVFIPDLIIC